ncbi:MAG: hypothetical protein ACT4PV_16330 [Planctomycetaceae bacterium]
MTRSSAAAHGLALLRVEADEGISAKRTSNRPALQRARPEAVHLALGRYRQAGGGVTLRRTPLHPSIGT